MKKKSKSMLCDHANEVPAVCKCDTDCYCKKHTCKTKKSNKKTKVNEIREKLQDDYPDIDLIFMTETEYDDAILGVMQGISREPAVAYSYEKVIFANMKMGMTMEQAIEYFEYNQIGAYVGKQTPVFIYKSIG